MSIGNFLTRRPVNFAAAFGVAVLASIATPSYAEPRNAPKAAVIHDTKSAPELVNRLVYTDPTTGETATVEAQLNDSRRCVMHATDNSQTIDITLDGPKTFKFVRADDPTTPTPDDKRPAGTVYLLSSGTLMVTPKSPIDGLQEYTQWAIDAQEYRDSANDLCADAREGNENADEAVTKGVAPTLPFEAIPQNFLAPTR